jgi:hypothetical protein
VANDEKIFVAAALVEELLEVLQGSLGSEGVGEQDLSLVAGLGSDKGGGLEAAFKRTGNDKVELYLQCIQYICEMKAVTLAVLVKGALEVEDWVFAANACAGVAKNK